MSAEIVTSVVVRPRTNSFSRSSTAAKASSVCKNNVVGCDSALLSALDACPAGAVVRLGVERAYMSQLLRVQRARGATGGDAFASALGLQRQVYPPGEHRELLRYIEHLS